MPRHTVSTTYRRVADTARAVLARAARWGWRAIPLPVRIGVVVVVVVGAIFTMFASAALLHSMTTAGSVYTVVDRVPGGQWVDEAGIVHNNKGRDDVSREDIEKFHAEMAQASDTTACMGNSPDVDVADIDSLYIAGQEEKDRVIAYQASLRDAARETPRTPQSTPRESSPAGLYDPQRRARVLAEDAKRAPNPPAVLPSEVSVSALVDPDLISTRPAVVPVGTPIMRGDRATTQYNRIIDQVPKGTDPYTATVFLFVAAGGGVVDWTHFDTVLNKRAVARPISAKNQTNAINVFFSTPFDTAPYRKAAGAGLIALVAEGTVTGDISDVQDMFEDCV